MNFDREIVLVMLWKDWLSSHTGPTPPKPPNPKPDNMNIYKAQFTQNSRSLSAQDLRPLYIAADTVEQAIAKVMPYAEEIYKTSGEELILKKLELISQSDRNLL